MVFKGKPKRGLKLSRIKQVTFVARRKRPLYSPNPSPITKRFKHSTPGKRTTPKKKRALVLSPSKVTSTPKQLSYARESLVSSDILEDLGCSTILEENETSLSLNYTSPGSDNDSFKMPTEIVCDLDINEKVTEDRENYDFEKTEEKLNGLLPPVIREFKKIIV